jgi:hypothetical protein
MPYHLEQGSDGHGFPKGKAIVVNSATGKHFSNSPIPLANAKKQLRLLQAIEHGYNKDGKERWAPKK